VLSVREVTRDPISMFEQKANNPIAKAGVGMETGAVREVGKWTVT